MTTDTNKPAPIAEPACTWREPDRAGMRYPGQSDLSGGATDCAPAPAVDERTADADSVDLAAASNGSPGGATYVDERGELRRERRRRPRDDDDERIEHLFVGFDNVIANADDYTRGYVRAMRQEFGQLIASLVR